MFGFFKRFQCQRAGNRRKSFQKILDRVAGLQVVELYVDSIVG